MNDKNPNENVPSSAPSTEVAPEEPKSVTPEAPSQTVAPTQPENVTDVEVVPLEEAPADVQDVKTAKFFGKEYQVTPDGGHRAIEDEPAPADETPDES